MFFKSLRSDVCELGRDTTAQLGSGERLPIQDCVEEDSSRRTFEGLPPGAYTLEFVHEKLTPPQDIKVTVGPKDSKTVDASFKGM